MLAAQQAKITAPPWTPHSPVAGTLQAKQKLKLYLARNF